MALFARMMGQGINSPLTSSCGRLFDAVAALLNLRHTVSYDGQGAIELEALAEAAEDERDEYPYKILNHSNLPSRRINNPLSLRERSRVRGKELPYMLPPHPACGHLLPQGEGTCDRLEDAPLQLDFSPMMPEILADIAAGIDAAAIAHRFHRTVASAAAAACLRISKATSLDRVILSGGVFQNRLLSEMIYNALSSKGINVFTHRLVPPNDGGIALGQAAIAGRRKV
jgi:hydrogenase maturation protein HypF